MSKIYKKALAEEILSASFSIEMRKDKKRMILKRDLAKKAEAKGTTRKGVQATIG